MACWAIFRPVYDVLLYDVTFLPGTFPFVTQVYSFIYYDAILVIVQIYVPLWFSLPRQFTFVSF